MGSAGADDGRADGLLDVAAEGHAAARCGGDSEYSRSFPGNRAAALAGTARTSTAAGLPAKAHSTRTIPIPPPARPGADDSGGAHVIWREEFSRGGAGAAAAWLSKIQDGGRMVARERGGGRRGESLRESERERESPGTVSRDRGEEEARK